MMGQFFRAHGKFCASHPWEVIVAVVTLTLCMMCKSTDNIPTLVGDVGGAGDGGSQTTVEDGVGNGGGGSNGEHQCHQSWSWRGGSSSACPPDEYEAEYNAADVILMTVVRCSAILYCYYQFRNLHKLGSKYILGEHFSIHVSVVDI